MARERSSFTVSRRSLSPLIRLSALLVSIPLAAGAQVIRLGGEFQVNSYSTGAQAAPSVATGANGNFVVAWESDSQDGSGSGIFARRFSSTGVPLGSEFQVNTFTSNNQQAPAAAAAVDGGFVVTWQSALQDGSGLGVFGRRFSSAGTPLMTEFVAASRTNGDQAQPSVAMDADGDFVVVWFNNSYVTARQFSSAGSPVGFDFDVSFFGALNPSVGADADGDFVVAWDNLQDVVARRFSSSGAVLGSEFVVNSYTPNAQQHPSVGMDADGDFVVAWQAGGTQAYNTFARRFSSTGAALDDEFQVSNYYPGVGVPALAVEAAGDFVVAWQSSQRYVFARRFSSAGAPLASEFMVDTYTADNYSRLPSVAASTSGSFVVAWQSVHDGSDAGVFAQRFLVSAVLDIDGDGDVGPLTDGLLVLRFLFGFTGTTLAGGAVGAGCSRCDASAIEPYLQTLI